MAKPPRDRTGRRKRERAVRKLVREQQRLAGMEAGGSPERPIDVPSSSVISVRSRATPCPLCGGTLRLDEETAEMHAGRSLRAAHMSCALCGVRRRLWFHISSPLPN